MFVSRYKKAHSKKNQGQSMVEFALAFPVFLLIIFAIVEFGMLIFSVTVVNGAAREGARYGAAKGVNNQYYNCAGIEGAVTGTGNLIGLSSANINITYDDGSGLAYGFNCTDLAAVSGSSIEAGDRVIVEVEYVYNPIMRNILGLPVPQLPLSSIVRRLIVKDLVIEGAAGTILNPVYTPTPVPVTACDAIHVDMISPLDMNDSAKTLDFDIRNNSSEIVRITQMYISWPEDSSDNGDLYAIRLKGALDLLIFVNGAYSSPVTIPDPYHAWNGNDTWRQISANTTSNVWFLFSHGAERAADDDYEITFSFLTLTTNETCDKTTSYDID